MNFIEHTIGVRAGNTHLMHEIYFLHEHVKGKGYIAGGFASEMFGRGKAGDIDIWPSSVNNFGLIQTALEADGFAVVHESALAITYKHPDKAWAAEIPFRKVQLIRYDPDLPLNSPERLITYFDLSVVQFVVLDMAVQLGYPQMSMTVKTTEQAMTDMDKGQVTVTRMGNPIIRQIRLAKYTGKGFHVLQRTWADVAAHIRSMDSSLYERTAAFINGESNDRWEDEQALRDGMNTLAPDIQELWNLYE